LILRYSATANDGGYRLVQHMLPTESIVQAIAKPIVVQLAKNFSAFSVPSSFIPVDEPWLQFHKSLLSMLQAMNNYREGEMKRNQKRDGI
jgi:hypothetical protein